MTTSKKLTILVTGANGQLGNCLHDIATTVPHKFVFTDVAEMDITSINSVRTVMEHVRPDWVINCAAYTAVDKAENEPDIAKRLNATAVAILADESQKVDAGIIHISTDYVFRGDDPQPRTESDHTEPQSVYGHTKLEGERFAAQNPKHMIIRTSWLYSIYGNNFVKTMRRLGGEKSEIRVVADQWGSPTSAHDLAKAILIAIEKPKPGLYHFSNEGVTNWALFAEKIMCMSKLNCKINHIPTAEYPTAACRPEYSLLDKRKFTETFDVIIPEWEASLKSIIAKLDTLS